MTFLHCGTCDGRGWNETAYAHLDGPQQIFRTICRGCRGSGQIKEREFVAPESFSWCLRESTVRYYRIDGLILTKAHRVNDQHRPICGAPVGHPPSECTPAPVSWPMCRKCAAKSVMPVPKIFEDAV